MIGCGVRMADVPFLPNSKELDHIVPLNVGGTHTIGNVRIICRRCNTGRPLDGSDYAGQLSLWCQDPEVAASLKAPSKCAPRCGCGKRLKNGHCLSCERRSCGERAAFMRADGIGWQQIADQLGLANTGHAYYLAKQYGDSCVVARFPERYQRAC